MIGKRVLFLGCHMDDVEYGCGGLIQVLKSEKKASIHIEVLSDHNENAADKVQLERKKEEMDSSMKILGCECAEYHVGNLAGQRFDSNQQRIREYLLNVRRAYQPDTIFFPAMKDVHQDHKTLAEEAFRIFRDSNCLGYEVIRSTTNFSPNMYCELTEAQVTKKADAILSYVSQQTESSAYYFSRDLIRSIAVFRGGFSGMSFAEAFEIYIYRMNEEK